MTYPQKDIDVLYLFHLVSILWFDWQNVSAFAIVKHISICLSMILLLVCFVFLLDIIIICYNRRNIFVLILLLLLDLLMLQYLIFLTVIEIDQHITSNLGLL